MSHFDVSLNAWAKSQDSVEVSAGHIPAASLHIKSVKSNLIITRVARSVKLPGAVYMSGGYLPCMKRI